MPLSKVSYTYAGTNLFAIDFPLGYLEESHVSARVNEEVDGAGNPIYRDITYVTTNTVSLSGTLNTGDIVSIERTVPSDELYRTFNDGERLTRKKTNDALKQCVMLVHELKDGRFSNLSTDLDAGGFKLSNLGDGEDSQDAATVGQLAEYTEAILGLNNNDIGIVDQLSTAVLEGTTSNVGDITSLSLVDYTVHPVCYLTDPVRYGKFKWTAGDHTSKVAIDPNKGVYVPSSIVPVTQGAWVREGDGKGNRLEARWFGAVLDGVVNDTPNVQAAIHYASDIGGHKVRIGKGTCRLLTGLVARDNVTVKCSSSTYFDTEDTTGDVIDIEGSTSTEYPLDAFATRGDYDIQIGGSPDLPDGATLHLVSQRNALSKNDSGNWWLGDGTLSQPYAYFSEWLTVAENTSPGNYRISSPILYPNYRTDNSLESESTRDKSTVKRVFPVKNFNWVGGYFNQSVNTGSSSLFDSRWAEECTVRDVTCVMGARAGEVVKWTASNKCTASNIKIINSPLLSWDYSVYHGRLNRLKTVGCQDSGFVACKSSFGAQTIDFTYGDTENNEGIFVNTRNFALENEFIHDFEGSTSHAGSYQEQWSNNRLLNCYSDGISCRGLEPTVTNNVITRHYTPGDTPDYTSAALDLLYGACRGAFVSGNRVKGFHSLVKIQDSTTLEWEYDDAEMLIQDNTVSDCFTGLYMDLDPYQGLRKVAYKNNYHTRMGRSIARLTQYCAGTEISGNTMAGNFFYSGVGTFISMLDIGNNNPCLKIKNNTWIRDKGTNPSTSNRLYSIGSVTDLTTYPEATYAGRTVIEGNEATFEEDLVDSFITGDYNQLKYNNDEQLREISSGVVKAAAGNDSSIVIKVLTESDASTDNLDSLEPHVNNVFKVGQLAVLKSFTSARDVVIRDVSISGKVDYGFQLPNNTSVTLNTSNDYAYFMFNGTHWGLIAYSDN